MSGLTIGDVRDALKTQLVANLSREVNVAERGQEMSGRPLIVVELREVPDYWVTFGSVGLAMVPFRLSIIVDGADTQSAVIRLDDLLSVGTGNDSSVVDALMDDVTLGAVVETLHVVGGSYDAEAVTATLDVDVTVRKIGAEV